MERRAGGRTDIETGGEHSQTVRGGDAGKEAWHRRTISTEADFVAYVEQLCKEEHADDKSWNAMLFWLRIYAQGRSVPFKEIDRQWCKGFLKFLTYEADAQKRRKDGERTPLMTSTVKTYFAQGGVESSGR